MEASGEKMKKSVAIFVCKSACVLLSIFALTGLTPPMIHAASGHRLRKTTAMSVIEISDEQGFEQQIQRAGIVVALVYLPTCDACKEILPQYANLANTTTNAPVTYLQANFYTVPSIVTQFSITSVPTFILYKNGVETQVVNSADIAQLQNAIQQNL